MVCERIHHDGKGRDMTAHNEDQEEHLSRPEDLAANGTSHQFTASAMLWT